MDVAAQLAEVRPQLERFVTAMLGDPVEGDDVVQSTCAAVLAGRFEGRSRFSTWVLGIAANQVRRRLRDRVRHADVVDPQQLDGRRGGQRGVLSSLFRRELEADLETAIAALPPLLKEAFVLRQLEGLGYEQIAEITGVAVGTLHVRAHRARGLLRAELGPVVDTHWRED